MPGIYSPTDKCESSDTLYQVRATLRCDWSHRAAMWLRFSWPSAKPENTPWLGSLLSQLMLSLLLHLSGLSRTFPLTNCLDKSFCLRVCFRRTQNSPAEPLGIPDSWKPWEIIKWLLFKPSFGVIWYAAMSSQRTPCNAAVGIYTGGISSALPHRALWLTRSDRLIFQTWGSLSCRWASTNVTA